MRAEQQLSVPQGDFQLQRYPHHPKDPLRAWDAADELLLNYLSELPQPLDQPWILNDHFGTLSVALNSCAPLFNSDSYIGRQALAHNYALNRLDSAAVTTQTPFEAPAAPVKLLLIKIPTTLALLEDQLHRVREHLAPDCQILGVAMAKHIHRSTLVLFERLLGPTTTSLAKKKARLVFSTLDPQLEPGPSPYPSQYQLEQTQLIISNHAGVFSREKLDIGTRLFLQHLPDSELPRTIIDLGCGNGLVGLIAAERNPQADMLFVDDSYRALTSARDNFEAAFGNLRSAQFQADNCLESVASDSADLILNNPPFHQQQQAIGDHIAKQMFSDAKRVLKSGGELWVIGNRHLGYHVQLRKLFGNCEQVATNPKFVVHKVVKG
ncbi:MAG: 23S rRNA (guanine1835-N2)-methyltransferase [Motiliproteus sp.]|jgi:23S rRNA (guanine1835-N2)-methyltransferase